MENKVKKCKYCGTEMDENAKICPNCKKSQKMSVGKIVLIVIGVLIIICILASIGGDNDTTNTTSNNNVNENNVVQQTETTNKQEKKNVYSLGETFTFDDLEITLGTDYSFVTLENQFSEHNGADVVKVPITVKNLKEETHSLNMFYISEFGSQGTELDDVSSYFSEDCVEFAGELRSGASYTKYLYFLYDGNGEYEVTFENFSTEIKVDFNITK